MWTGEFCHPCARVMWNKDVLRAEEEHKEKHAAGTCDPECETIFYFEDREARLEVLEKDKRKGCALKKSKPEARFPEHLETTEAYNTFVEELVLPGSSNGFHAALKAEAVSRREQASWEAGIREAERTAQEASKAQALCNSRVQQANGKFLGQGHGHSTYNRNYRGRHQANLRNQDGGSEHQGITNRIEYMTGVPGNKGSAAGQQWYPGQYYPQRQAKTSGSTTSTGNAESNFAVTAVIIQHEADVPVANKDVAQCKADTTQTESDLYEAVLAFHRSKLLSRPRRSLSLG